MNLEQIQEMWEKDSKIDPDNLHDESLKIPQLHSKYYTLYNTITLLRERAREQYSKVRLERYNYYTGKATAEVYAEAPFPYKVREKDAIQRYNNRRRWYKRSKRSILRWYIKNIE